MKKDTTFKENGLDIENLKKAIAESKYGRIKNYKVMAEVLGDKYTTDKKKRDLQLKEWKRYFNYKITGNGSYEIKEIYDEPLPPKEPKIKKKRYEKPEIIFKTYEDELKERKAELKKQIEKEINKKIDIPKMNIYKLYKDVKNNPVIIEGYQNLCDKLNIPFQCLGKDREKQLKELNHFIDYQEIEDKYIITEVFFPFIRTKFLNSLFLREPDYYYMPCVYSYSDEESIEFHYAFLTYKTLILIAYYHYHDKINTLLDYPEEKDLRIKIEKIISDYDVDFVKEEFNDFITQYEESYKKGFVDKKISESTRKKPRIKKTITVYEEDYKKILKFAKEKGIKILEE